MRVVVLLAAVLAVGCSPLRHCKVDADCAANQTCHPKYLFCVWQADAGVDAGPDPVVPGPGPNGQDDQWLGAGPTLGGGLSSNEKYRLRLNVQPAAGVSSGQ
jgi:hypothetical protein